MTRGKRTCKILKEIRQQIADNNDIEYVTSECHFQGECTGTCPKCEAEVKYLENELNKRKQLGKAVAIAGISLGIAGSFSACNAPNQENTINTESENLIENSVDTMPPIMDKTFIGTIEEKWMDGSIVGEIGMEISPMYPGGEEALLEFIKENLTYPKEAQEKGIEGKVVIRFCIEEDGNVSTVEVLKGIGYGCDEEALRAVKMMPKWKPGQVGEKKVKMMYSIPIVFSLNDTEK